MAQEVRKANGLSLDFIFHPGDTLAEVLEDRNMTQTELALRTSVSKKHISSIVSGKKDISISFAKKLEYALDIEAQFWINLQSNYDREILEYNEANSITEEELDVLNRLKEVIRDFKLFGIIDPDANNSEKVLALRSILNISNLCSIPKLAEAAAFRIQDSVRVDPYILFAWQKLCELSTEDVALDYLLDIQQLNESLEDIKSLMFKNPNVMRKELKEILGKCGIKFEIVPNYTGAPVQGYIKNDNGQLLLCMTIRGKYSDVFWFTLFHELGHIVNGDTTNTFIDFKASANMAELKADEFAKNTLLDAELYNDFVMKGKYNSIQEIKKLASACNVEPFIVIGRLMKEELIDWGDFKPYRKKYEWGKE